MVPADRTSGAVSGRQAFETRLELGVARGPPRKSASFRRSCPNKNFRVITAPRDCRAPDRLSPIEQLGRLVTPAPALIE